LLSVIALVETPDPRLYAHAPTIRFPVVVVTAAVVAVDELVANTAAMS
jgi:hypothetical protein